MKLRPRSRFIAALLAVAAVCGTIMFAPSSPANAAIRTTCPAGTLSQLNGKTEITTYINVTLKSFYGVGSVNNPNIGFFFTAGTISNITAYDDTKRAYYQYGSQRRLNLRPCETKTTIAHEYGHYINDRAAKFDPISLYTLARKFITWTNWLKYHDPDGVERAGHCLGYLAVPNGEFTRCPDANALAYAKDLARWARY